MKYTCKSCGQVFDSDTVKFKLYTAQDSTKKVRYCEPCYTKTIKTAALESTEKFLKGAHIGI